MGEKSETAEEPKRKRVDLSVPQVAGSAVAAVLAAKLASCFGVYGTILGAGLVSAIATCGGTVFQHFFRRTGEQIREVTVPARPGSMQESQVGIPAPEFGDEFGEGFGAGTVYRAQVRSWKRPRWKRPVLAAALVFGVTMAGISTYELALGNSFSGGGGTTVGDALSGRNKAPSSGDTPSSDSSPTPSTDDSPTPSGSDSPGSDSPGSEGGGKAQSPTPTPGSTDGPGSDGASTPPPSPSAPTTPAPGASSRSQSADPGRVDPSGQ